MLCEVLLHTLRRLAIRAPEALHNVPYLPFHLDFQVSDVLVLGLLPLLLLVVVLLPHLLLGGAIHDNGSLASSRSQIRRAAHLDGLQFNAVDRHPERCH
jgi:hypothetical protein